MKKILVIGSTSIDMVTSTGIMPKPGETVIGDSFLTNIGGKGANQAFAAYYLDSDVTFWGSIGNDSNGKTIEDFFKKEGIKYVFKKNDISTGIATIIVDSKSAQNQIVIVPGSNHKLLKEDIDHNIDLIKENDIIVLQLEINLETTWYIIKKAYELGKIIILNPAPATTIPLDVLSKVDYLVPNETELELLTPNIVGDYLTKAKSLVDIGVKNVIVTLGEKGSLYCNKNDSFEIKPFKVDAIDTTAAGDSFIGAFVSALSQDIEIKKALEFASKASSITVTRKGALMSLPRKNEIK